MSDNNGTPESAFSWVKVWTSPLGMFIILVVLVLTVVIFVVVQGQRTTNERREAFCQSEIENNKRERLLWENVIEFSNEAKTPAEIEADKPRMVRFREFIEETYPVGDCPLAPGTAPKPTSTSR